MIDAVRKDKKRENDIVHFVLLDGIGQAVVEALPLADLEGYIEKGLGVHEEKGSI